MRKRNKYQDTSRFLEDTCVSAYVALLFGFYALSLLLMTTPTEAQWFYADPILKIFLKAVTLWGIPILSILLFFFWKGLWLKVVYGRVDESGVPC
jgi:predicted Co/Zn/Cd cation transporter (cation efflux family)